MMEQDKMENKEFNLSVKINETAMILLVRDVKEFIRLLKEELIKTMYQRGFRLKNNVHPVIHTDTMEEIIKRKIKKLAGDELK